MFQEVVPCSCSQVLVENMEGKLSRTMNTTQIGRVANFEHISVSCSIECTGTVSASQSQGWINKFPSSQ